MNMAWLASAAHSPVYYYSIAALIYLGVLILVGYYCRTCILTPGNDKKIIILLVGGILTFVVSQLFVGAMILNGYETQYGKFQGAIGSALEATLGLLLIGLAGWLVPVMVNYFYFKREVMTDTKLKTQQHFYATNRSWLMVRTGGVFITMSFMSLGFFILLLFAQYTDNNDLRIKSLAISQLLVLSLLGAYIGKTILRSNDLVFKWKPQIV
ncbi:hypothetical protein [Schleiferilactobacillus perolens]|uniref:Uncharacterized protein n=1 Tax=Schleiferilactobacillus perolens DSM 12744 TaxID=1423792 RepID=A0A0R1MLQ1_9LACO|nr:hypothetical protein [Schleiferilactobacillus perolens]KRL08780.1 hypothetical protein FD09_GL001153 [Schleiferilactobacillus perolens DSM 12744]